MKGLEGMGWRYPLRDKRSPSIWPWHLRRQARTGSLAGEGVHPMCIRNVADRLILLST